jgi:MFS family permease
MTKKPDPSRIPVPTWLLLGSLYTTQYLGLGFLVVALVAILRDEGAPLDQVGLVFLLGMVWPLKFLWAPLIDRVRFGRLGHYRVWLLLMQGALVMVLFAMGYIHPARQFEAVYALALLLALFSATQDIAVDGMACRLLSPEARGPANGLQIAGGLLGNMLGGGVVLMAYPTLGWQIALFILAACTMISFVQLLFFREPVWEVAQASEARLLRSIARFWKRPGGPYWLFVVALYCLGASLTYGVLVPFLVDRGWDMERIGLEVNILGSLLAIASALLTGRIIRRMDRGKALIGGAIVQFVAIAAIALPVVGFFGDVGLTVACCFYFLFYPPAATILATAMMDHTSFERPATDYTFQSSLNILFAIASMSAAAALADLKGYPTVLMVALSFAGFAIVLAFRYRPTSCIIQRLVFDRKQR